MANVDFNLLTLAVGVGSLIMLFAQLRSNHVWNQKCASYELMNETINSGHMSGAMEQLQTKSAGTCLLAVKPTPMLPRA